MTVLGFDNLGFKETPDGFSLRRFDFDIEGFFILGIFGLGILGGLTLDIHKDYFFLSILNIADLIDV